MMCLVELIGGRATRCRKTMVGEGGGVSRAWLLENAADSKVGEGDGKQSHWPGSPQAGG